MASNVIKCRLLVENPVRSNEPQVISLNSIKLMPVEARKQWIEAILEAQRIGDPEKGQVRDSFQEYLLRVDGTIVTSTSSTDLDAEISTVEYQPLSEVINAFTVGAGAEEDYSAHNSASSDRSHHSSGSENLSIIPHVNMVDNLGGVGAQLSTVTYGCLKATAKVRRSFHQIGPAFFKSMTDTSSWVRANPLQTASILGGTTLLTLSCATPAILGAVGFSSVGPVAGSAAAAWQASMGSVVAGSVFAFLQSAAMGGAALGVITGVGAAIGGAAVAVGLAFSKGGVVEEVVDKVKDFVEKEIVGGLFKKVQGFFEKKD